MCGIAGAINYQRFDLERMQAALRHRGPDEQSIYTHENVALVHTRLAIQDIAHGSQPMHFGRYTIIYNGEIYNHGELRGQMDDEFLTRSDTETLVHLYGRHQEKCLEMLEGMFAVAILDRQAGTIFLARDRAGKKPLYIYQNQDSLIFASELNAIRATVSLEIEEKHICQYLRLMEFLKPNTPYRDVYELEPGSWLRINVSDLSIQKQRWWRIDDFYRQPLDISLEEAQGEVEGRLRQAIKRRLENSDLEVGVFLSGGIDSTLITALAAEFQSPLKTFTISFEGAYDEAPLAEQVARKYQTDHTVIRISYDHLVDDLEKILTQYGEPFADSSAIPSYYVSREAKKHVTVILNGDGADEIFGGYRRYVPFSKFDFFGRRGLGSGLARGLKYVMPLPKEKMSPYTYWYRLMELASRTGLECYLSASRDVFEGYEENILRVDYLDEVEEVFERINGTSLSSLQKIMNLDFDTFLHNDLLVKMDIATMAHALEGRSPFLSKDFLEYVPRLGDDFKIRGKVTKYMLRELGKKYLPRELVYQPKRGFEVPLKRWIDGQLKDMVFDYLEGDCYSQRFIRREFLSKLLYKRVRVAEEKRAKMLWALLALEIWYKQTKGM